ncbi:MAG: IS66 family insertion sequence element accessory protein TnpB [Acutalibacteraceae bacterium]|nr:IS66 family insertion sequence element accessory protein TnpB [Acutalibacteraceae bacterium]
MFEYSDYKIILCCGATDMRKSINGLSEIVCEQFQLDPRDKIIFAFCNNNRNRIKLLVWADNGFWIHFKRIERGRVVWPTEKADEKTMILAYDDLKNIIIAPGITQKIKRTEVWKKC